MSDYSYIGAGKVFLRETGASAGLIHVGNCSKLDFSIDEETKELQDYTQTGGGTYNEVRRIKSVELAMALHDLDSTNLARALYGADAAVASAAVVDETHVAWRGAMIPFDHIPLTSVAPVVTNATGSTTYVAGTDYEVRPGGIAIPTGSAILDGASILVDYTKAAANVVEALTNAGKEYEVFFEGLNEARNGKAVLVRAWRVKIGAAKTLSLIGADYAELAVTGKLLKDATKTGAGVSQYFKVQIAQ